MNGIFLVRTAISRDGVVRNRGSQGENPYLNCSIGSVYGTQHCKNMAKSKNDPLILPVVVLSLITWDLCSNQSPSLLSTNEVGTLNQELLLLSLRAHPWCLEKATEGCIPPKDLFMQFWRSEGTGLFKRHRSSRERKIEKILMS